MGIVSILFNIVTLCAVFVTIFIISKLYKSAFDQNVSVRDVMASLENDPDTVSHAYMYAQTGSWSASQGGDAWGESKNIKIYDIPTSSSE